LPSAAIRRPGKNPTEGNKENEESKTVVCRVPEGFCRALRNFRLFRRSGNSLVTLSFVAAHKGNNFLRGIFNLINAADEPRINTNAPEFSRSRAVITHFGGCSLLPPRIWPAALPQESEVIFERTLRRELRGRSVNKPLNVLGTPCKSVILRFLYRHDCLAIPPLVNFRMAIRKSEATSAIVVARRQIYKS
jgi:hypothetical protein